MKQLIFYLTLSTVLLSINTHCQSIDRELLDSLFSSIDASNKAMVGIAINVGQSESYTRNLGFIDEMIFNAEEKTMNFSQGMMKVVFVKE